MPGESPVLAPAETAAARPYARSATRAGPGPGPHDATDVRQHRLPRRPTAARTLHAAVAAPYPHRTVPLRRLADRCAGELCLAASADRAAPSGCGMPRTHCPPR